MHRARVEAYVVRRVDPLDGPLAVALGAAHQLQVLEQPAAGGERELLRALEAAAVQLLLAEQPLQVLLPHPPWLSLERPQPLLALPLCALKKHLVWSLIPNNLLLSQQL